MSAGSCADIGSLHVGEYAPRWSDSSIELQTAVGAPAAELVALEVGEVVVPDLEEIPSAEAPAALGTRAEFAHGQYGMRDDLLDVLQAAEIRRDAAGESRAGRESRHSVQHVIECLRLAPRL